MSPGLVGHHVALLWCSVTLGVRRDDESGRQRLARGEPFALGVVQAASTAAARSARWKFLLKSTAISGFWWQKTWKKMEFDKQAAMIHFTCK